MHSKSENIEVTAYDDTNEIIEELFDLLLFRYQIALGTQMRGSDFIFDCIILLYYKYHKTNFKRGLYVFSGLDKKERDNNKS